MISKGQPDIIRGPIDWSPLVLYGAGEVINVYGLFGLACAKVEITAGKFSKAFKMGSRGRHRRTKALARDGRRFLPLNLTCIA